MGSIIVDGHTLKSLDNKFGHISNEFKEHQIKFAREYRKTHDDQLPHTLYWDFLRARYDLAKIEGHLIRFEHYHPLISKWIKEEEMMPGNPGIPGIPTPLMPPVPPGGPSVPEPSTLILFTVAIVIGYCGSYMLRRIVKNGDKIIC